jgi:hypothetical protein
MRVAAGRLEICYTYRASFTEGEVSESRRVSWSYVAGVEVKMDSHTGTWDVLIRFDPPVPYARGVIGSFKLNGFASEAKALAISQDIRYTRTQRALAFLRVLNVTYSENSDPFGR